MAKRDDFYGLEIKVVYEEHSVCAYEDGDETFHTIHHEADDDFGGVALKYKEAYIKVTKLTPAEGKLRAEFNELKKAHEKTFNQLGIEFWPFSRIEEPKLERSRVEFLEEVEELGEIDITKEEYEVLSRLKCLFFGGREKFVIEGNGKTFYGVVPDRTYFNWAQLRSFYNPREICGADYLGWNSLKEDVFELFKELFTSIREDL